MAFLLLLLALLGVLVCYAVLIEPRRVKFRRKSLEIASLAEPLRVVAVADLHPTDLHWSTESLAGLMRRIDGEKPDLVLWLGDYANAPGRQMRGRFWRWFPRARDWVARRMPVSEEVAFEMGRVSTTIGQFAVLGPEDVAAGSDRVRGHLNDNGIATLDWEAAEILDEDGETLLHLVGIGPQSEDVPPEGDTYSGTLRTGIPAIAMAHDPAALGHILHRVDLALAASAHGGQVRLPMVGPVRARKRVVKAARIASSLVEGKLVLTSGVGTPLPPIRFGCPPEVLVIDLVPA